jgi:predicted AlkP superfamily pyrophosphatase or phosphodiesterase
MKTANSKTLWSFVLILWLAFAFSIYGQKPIKNLKPTVILVGIDALRYDYLEKYKPRNLNRLARRGVRAKWMIPSFPTKTFPNFYTIATGLYPENHGIIENNIYDRGFNAVFGLGKREEVQNSRWWFGEPIWSTAEKQGQKTGTFFYPGTEAEIAGARPTYWKSYDGKIPNAERIDTVLSWLDLPPEKRPTFLTLYFSDVDDAGHNFATGSIEVGEAVKKVDLEIGNLIEGLKKRQIFEKVNLILVSDHGMATVDLRKAVFLDDIINFKDTERILWTNEIVQIFPKNGKENEIIRELKSKITQAQCWRKSEIPARFHYRASTRIAPIVCSTDEGKILTSRSRYEDLKKREKINELQGAHGYDNQLESMRATFIAHGSAFKKRKLIEPFENIHVYNLMTKILKLKPAPNDGNLEAIKQVLR